MEAAWRETRLMQVYEKHKLPYTIRCLLYDALRAIPWREILLIKDPDELERVAGDAYRTLTSALEEMMQENSGTKPTLKAARQQLQGNFEGHPGDLVEAVADCLKAEEKENLASEFRDVSALLEKVESMVKNYNEAKVARDEMLLNSVKEALSTTYLSTWKALQKLCNSVHTLTSHMPVVKRSYVSEAEGEAILDICHQELTDYRLRQRQSLYDDQVFPPDLKDKHEAYLDRICNEAISHLLYTMDQNEELIQVLQRYYRITGEPCADNINTRKDVQQQLQLQLATLIHKCFVVTLQPQNIINVQISKRNAVDMCIELFGARSLGLDKADTLPKVTLTLHEETQLRSALQLETLRDIERLVKDNKTEIKQSRNIKMAIVDGRTMCNMRKLVFTCKTEKQADRVPEINIVVRRRGKTDRARTERGNLNPDEKVPEIKHGVICHTNIVVRGQAYYLKELSQPISLVTQTGQYVTALGNLIWNAAFPTPERRIYEERSEVTWAEYKPVLAAMFAKVSDKDKVGGVSLEEEHLHYLKNFVLGREPDDPDIPDSDLELSKDVLLRKNGKDFTFSSWLLGCKYLIEDYIHDEWTRGLVKGFCSREQAQNVLQSSPPGSVLVRFREKVLEKSQKIRKSALIAISVVIGDSGGDERFLVHWKKDLNLPNLKKEKRGLFGILGSLWDQAKSTKLVRTIVPGDVCINTVLDGESSFSSCSSVDYSQSHIVRLIHWDGTGRNPLPSVSEQIGGLPPQWLNQVHGCIATLNNNHGGLLEHPEACFPPTAPATPLNNHGGLLEHPEACFPPTAPATPLNNHGGLLEHPEACFPPTAPATPEPLVSPALPMACQQTLLTPHVFASGQISSPESETSNQFPTSVPSPTSAKSPILVPSPFSLGSPISAESSIWALSPNSSQSPITAESSMWELSRNSSQAPSPNSSTSALSPNLSHSPTSAESPVSALSPVSPALAWSCVQDSCSPASSPPHKLARHEPTAHLADHAPLLHSASVPLSAQSGPTAPTHISAALPVISARPRSSMTTGTEPPVHRGVPAANIHITSQLTAASLMMASHHAAVPGAPGAPLGAHGAPTGCQAQFPGSRQGGWCGPVARLGSAQNQFPAVPVDGRTAAQATFCFMETTDSEASVGCPGVELAMDTGVAG